MNPKSELQKYYALPLWKQYQTAYGVWEVCHGLYCENPTPTTRAKLIEAMDTKDALIAQLRETPQHKLAFGW